MPRGICWLSMLNLHSKFTKVSSRMSEPSCCRRAVESHISTCTWAKTWNVLLHNSWQWATHVGWAVRQNSNLYLDVCRQWGTWGSFLAGDSSGSPQWLASSAAAPSSPPSLGLGLPSGAPSPPCVPVGPPPPPPWCDVFSRDSASDCGSPPSGDTEQKLHWTLTLYESMEGPPAPSRLSFRLWTLLLFVFCHYGSPQCHSRRIQKSPILWLCAALTFLKIATQAIENFAH